MPVDDHPTHPSTSIGPDFRYGCWNRGPFRPAYQAHPWSTPVEIPHTLSTECRYDLSPTDPACTDCKWKEK